MIILNVAYYTTMELNTYLTQQWGIALSWIVGSGAIQAFPTIHIVYPSPVRFVAIRRIGPGPLMDHTVHVRELFVYTQGVEARCIPSAGTAYPNPWLGYLQAVTDNSSKTAWFTTQLPPFVDKTSAGLPFTHQKGYHQHCNRV